MLDAAGTMDSVTGTELRADCANCAGLCCVALAFTSPADFAITKPAGEPCPNLAPDLRCTIHAELRERGFPGCAAYDCFGAGQRVTQVTFGARSWRTHPEIAADMFAALPIARELHEMLWYLADARARPECVPIAGALDAAARRIDSLAGAGADDLLRTDVEAERAAIRPVLRQASGLVRGGRTDARQLAGADLMGARLRGTDLRAADLRGAYLIGAELRGADLNEADLIGADLRDADLRGADLGTALFVTQAQVAATRGDPATTLPPRVERPPHW